MRESKDQTEEKLNKILYNQNMLNKKLDFIIQLLTQQSGVDNLQLLLQTMSLADLTGLERR